MASVSPLQGVKMGQFRSASDQKNTQKNEHSAAFIARQQPAVFEDMFVELSVWGLKSRKILRNGAGPFRSRSKCVELETQSVGEISGVVRRTPILLPPLPWSTKLMAYLQAPFRRTSSHRRCGNVGWSPYSAVGGFCLPINLACPCKWGLIYSY